MVKITQGPWLVSSDLKRQKFQVLTSIDSKPICTLEGECSEGNARLIAASPELLSALLLIAEMFTNSPIMVDGGLKGIIPENDIQALMKVRDAIARAIGES